MSYSRDSIRNALLELVARRDPTVFQDADVFEKKIQQIGKWPTLPEITALKAGLSERFPWELQKDPSRVVSPRVAENLAAMLHKKYGIEPDIAIWAVISWGISLGLKVPEPEVKKSETPTQDPDKTGSFAAAKPSTQSTTQAPANAEVPPPPQETIAKPALTATPAPSFSEPDTSSTRLGVIFGSDEAGLIRVYKSWFDNAPENEASRMIATTVKIQAPKPVPLFTAAPKSKTKKAPKPVNKPEPSHTDQPQMLKKTTTRTVQNPANEPVNNNRPPQATETKNEADSLLAKANSLLPGGAGRLDIREALGLLQLAVKKGSIKARRRFGEIYLKGIGVNENLPNAASWFKTAAELGDAESQFQLGSLYACGVGVEYNAELAKSWLQEAASQGHKGAEELLNQISSA